MRDEEMEAELESQQSVNPSLRGWSEGDEERPVPTPEGNALEEALKGWNQPADAAKRQLPIEDQFMEFTLYYERDGARHVVRERRYRQIKHAALLTTENVPLVLMTEDFRVYAAKSIWGLLWVYFKTKIFGMKKSRVPRKYPLPKYK